MTEPLGPPGQIVSDQSEQVAGDPNLKRKGRFSPLFVALTFMSALFLGAAIGYGLGRSQSGPPVQVVVTATPGEAVAQTGGTQARPAEEPEPATEADSTAAAATPTIMDFVLSDARHFQGEAGAPITMVEFSDFKWPYCGRFAAETLSRIREQYVSSGKVRFAYKHFAILGPESSRAAEASECAAEQGQFWAFHDRTFVDQITERSSLSVDRLTELAGEIGLDTSAFRDCLDSGQYTSQITQESLSVQSMGVRGTPAFLINGVFVSGAQPFEVFQQLFDDQLAQLGVESEAPELPAETATAQSPSDVSGGEIEDTEIEGVIFFPEQSRDHEDGEIEYEHEAPPGGAHSDDWQNCGIYDEPLAEEPVVHSLEHGAVWVAYRPDLPAEQVETLKNIVRAELQTGTEPLVLLSPQLGLDAPIVVTAWQVQLQLEEAADPRLPLFLKKYQDGPYTPEPGAPCSNGIGQPFE